MGYYFDDSQSISNYEGTDTGDNFICLHTDIWDKI